MRQLMLQFQTERFEGPCVVCERLVALEAGLQLCDAERKGPVCSGCGRRVAPELAALQGLADSAERVGRINSHTITPPLTALLDLARAAERFTATAGAATP